MLELISFCIVGYVCGYGIRRITPFLIKKKDRSKPFSWPWVECLTLVAFVSLYSKDYSIGFYAQGAILALFLVAITSTDFLSKMIPVKPIYIGTFLGILSTCLMPDYILAYQHQGQIFDLLNLGTSMAPWVKGLIMSLAGAFVGFCFLELIRRVIGSATQMEVMGMGDSMILMLIGAFIGPKMVLFSILPAAIIGILIGLYFKWFKGLPHSPFGPALAIGGWLQFLYWNRIQRGIDLFYERLYSMPPWVMSLFGFLLLVILFLLILRIKSRAYEYKRMIDEDYEEISKDLEE